MSSALLVMDMQSAIVERFAGDRATELLVRLRQAIDAARRAGVQVIYVRVAFREGAPEISARNLTFSRLAEGAPGLTEADPGSAIHQALAPTGADVIVTKKRVSAFTGSDLELVLRSRGIEQLVLSGIATSGVVLSTLREAADRDFTLTVLSDGCLDSDHEVHRVLIEKVFPRQARVLDIEQWTTEILATPPT